MYLYICILVSIWQDYQFISQNSMSEAKAQKRQGAKGTPRHF